jgi:two-component system, OmpR family, phosphate regulon sensor histidine kinase PhoR
MPLQARFARELWLAVLAPAATALVVELFAITLGLPALAAVLLAMGIAGGVGALVLRKLNRRFLTPFDHLLDGARRLAAGDYAHRLSAPDLPELSSLARALNALALRVAEEVRAAEGERDHLRTILARMAEGVLVVGADGRALLVNPAFQRLFGLRGEVAGLAPLELVRKRELARLVERVLSEGSGASEALDLEVDLPEPRSLSLTAAALGTGKGAVIVVTDTTAFTRLARMRRDFVANVSHELKTPLAAIRGYTETLRDGALEDGPTARRFLDRVLVQCRRLQALLEDLLTLSRLESTENPLPLAPVDLPAIAHRAAEVAAELARERGITLERSFGATPSAEGHAESLERLLLNLLENAIKYNRPQGTVRLRLGTAEGGACLEVSDTGIGIPTEALPRLFERFYRVDKGRSRDEGGTGLGLAIVKHIVQAHGGRVDVVSREGEGSTFRVWLPARAPHPREP